MTRPEFKNLADRLKIPEAERGTVWRIAYRLSIVQAEAAIRSAMSQTKAQRPTMRLTICRPTLRMAVCRLHAKNVQRSRQNADENHPCSLCDKGVVFARTATGAEYSFACAYCLKPRVLGLKFPIWNDQEGFTREQRAM